MIARTIASKRSPKGSKRPPSGVLAYEVVNIGSGVDRTDVLVEPVRTHGRSTFVGSGEYVRFLDEKDGLLHAISEIIINSPTLRAIIQQKTQLSIGDGFLLLKGRPESLFSSSRKKRETEVDEQLIEKLDKSLLDVNASGESLIDVMERAMTEFWTFGNCYIGIAKKDDQFFAYLHPFATGRPRKKNDDGEITHIGFSDNWKERVWDGSTVKDIPIFPEFEADSAGVERSVIHIKNHAAGFEYFGLPDWIAGFQFAEIEYLMPRYNVFKFKNGYAPSGIVQFFGASSEEEGKEIIKSFINKMTGDDNNSKLFVQVLRDETLKANVQVIEDKNDGSYMELSRLAAQGIVSASRWTMSLAGFATKGQLGSNEQIRREFEIAMNTVIRPAQNLFLRRFVNAFVGLLGENDAKLKGVHLDIATSLPVSFAGDINVDQILTTDEKRQLVGYDPMPVRERGGDVEQFRNTVNSFSPLLANKMIDKLTDDEIRLLLGSPKTN